jgi:TolA-binding protein
MPDFHTPEDEAALYVLGELNPAERRDFEARLQNSPELRELVNSLVEGTVAMSMLPPRRKPPQGVWGGIEKRISANERPKSEAQPFWLAWLRNGWAVAAACVAGWMLHTLWISQTGPGNASQNASGSKPVTQIGTLAVGSSKPNPADTSLTPEPDTTAQALLDTKSREIGALRDQISQLETQVTFLSQTATQQQARLAETGRFKFLQLTTASNGAAISHLSPEMQHALFVAMARELGWLPASDSTNGSQAPSVQLLPTTYASSSPTNAAGVDFVDLRPAASSITNQPRMQPTATTNSPDAMQTQRATAAASVMLPAFISGDNIVVAVDPTTVSPGSQLTIATGMSNQAPQTLGTVVMGTNPFVMTIPMSGGYAFANPWTAAGFNLYVSTLNTAGGTSVLQFFAPTNQP